MCHYGVCLRTGHDGSERGGSHYISGFKGRPGILILVSSPDTTLVSGAIIFTWLRTLSAANEFMAGDDDPPPVDPPPAQPVLAVGAKPMEIDEDAMTARVKTIVQNLLGDKYKVMAACSKPGLWGGTKKEPEYKEFRTRLCIYAKEKGVQGEGFASLLVTCLTSNAFTFIHYASKLPSSLALNCTDTKLKLKVDFYREKSWIVSFQSKAGVLQLQKLQQSWKGSKAPKLEGLARKAKL